MLPFGLQPLVPTEICERIIDFVAIRDEAIWAYPHRIWHLETYKTLQACSLTCHAWRSRSQFYLMHLMSVQPSLAEDRCFDNMLTLFNEVPHLKNSVEFLSVNGKELKIARFHLVPLKLYEAMLPLRVLLFSNGLLYFPTAFPVCMRRFTSMVELRLHHLTLISDNDLRRMLNALRSLQKLYITSPEWAAFNANRRNYVESWPRSHLRLLDLQIEAESRWIGDFRTVRFFNWLSSSGAISHAQQIGLSKMMLINDDILATIARLIHACSTSHRLDCVALSLRPEIDLTICKYCPCISCRDMVHGWILFAVDAPLCSLPRLQNLYFMCPYDVPILCQLASCLSSIFPRPQNSALPQLNLTFQRYPDYKEPPPECWEELDNAMQHQDLKVRVDCIYYKPDGSVIWGDFYNHERRDGLDDMARKLFPKAFNEGRLWVANLDGMYHIVR